MNTLRGLLVLIVLLGGMLAAPVLADSQVETAEGTQIDLRFDGIRQGRLGTVDVRGADLAHVQAALLGAQFRFFPVSGEDDLFRGYIAAPMDAPPGFHDLAILAIYADGREDFHLAEVRILAGGFAETTFSLPRELQDLADHNLYLDELALLNAYIQAGRAAEGSWHQRGIVPPLTRRLTAGYGTFRYFSGPEWQRHSGVDYAAPEGTPIPNMASGRVVAILQLPLRGNYVLIDHGGGLFSGYAHLLEVTVRAGDFVIPGDEVGTLGNTGRSTGPHLHWEIALGGVWVDPLDFAARFSAD
ncbi:MAG: M23 family metallopeptidase [Anaerolineales bacterium]